MTPQPKAASASAGKVPSGADPAMASRARPNIAAALPARRIIPDQRPGVSVQQILSCACCRTPGRRDARARAAGTQTRHRCRAEVTRSVKDLLLSLRRLLDKPAEPIRSADTISSGSGAKWSPC
jgi:hypothetical protein